MTLFLCLFLFIWDLVQEPWLSVETNAASENSTVIGRETIQNWRIGQLRSVLIVGHLHLSRYYQRVKRPLLDQNSVSFTRWKLSVRLSPRAVPMCCPWTPHSFVTAVGGLRKRGSHFYRVMRSVIIVMLMMLMITELVDEREKEGCCKKIKCAGL